MRSFLPAMLALLLLVATLPALLFASGKNEDFPLQVHIVRVEAGRGQIFLIDGTGGSFGSYLYTIHIDGDPRELTMTPYSIGLHVGNYRGHWNKNGSLEIQAFDAQGKPKKLRFLMRGEKLLKPEQPAEDKQPAK